MILVTGATGTIGSEVVRQLAARGVPVRAMTRNPGRAEVPAGVDVVYGDFDDPVSLEHAARGASGLFQLTVAGSEVARHDLAMFEAVAGIGKIVKLSASGTGEENVRGPGKWHIPGEQALPRTGASWTVLRPTSFATNSLQWASAIKAGEPVPNLTGDGKAGVVDPWDVAAVAVEALLTPAHEGQVYTLTGPDLLSAAEQVAILESVLGHGIKTVDISLETAREQMLAAGMDFVDERVEGAALLRAGAGARLTGDVERVLGRRPRTYLDWAHDNVQHFR